MGLDLDIALRVATIAGDYSELSSYDERCTNKGGGFSIGT